MITPQSGLLTSILAVNQHQFVAGKYSQIICCNSRWYNQIQSLPNAEKFLFNFFSIVKPLDTLSTKNWKSFCADKIVITSSSMFDEEEKWKHWTEKGYNNKQLTNGTLKHDL